MYRREPVNVRFRAGTWTRYIMWWLSWGSSVISIVSPVSSVSNLTPQRFSVQFEWINHLAGSLIFFSFPQSTRSWGVISVIKVRILQRSLICTSSHPLIIDETKLQTSLPHPTSSVTHPDLIFAARSIRRCDRTGFVVYENVAPFEWIHAFSFQLAQQHCDRWRGKSFPFQALKRGREERGPGRAIPTWCRIVWIKVPGRARFALTFLLGGGRVFTQRFTEELISALHL